MKKLMVLILICVLSMTACNNSKENLDDTKAVFQAKIVEVHDGVMIMEPLDDYKEAEYAEQISMTIQNMSDSEEPVVGDVIEITYNGIMTEEYPPSPAGVEKIEIVSEAETMETAIPSARIPMVMVDGQLYYATGKESTIEARCGMMDGEITSSVDGSETPVENNQSNFGTGYGYQFVSENTIEILMEDGIWYVYEAGSGEGKISFGDTDKWYDKGYLSEETLKWLYWYNSLTEEEQFTVNAVPKELLEAGEELLEENKNKEDEFLEENMETEEAPASIRVENPSWDYYISENIQSGTKPYTLKLVEEKANEIIDTDEWLVEHELNYDLTKELDGKYTTLIENNGTLINIFEYGTCIAGLDFTDYMYAPDLVEADKEFVDETVHDAKIVNGILYVSIFHYTYAASAPSNGYIMAIDLEDYSVIWKSQPLVCNSLNFEIVDDIIFCGYGFTAEPDYLYQIDRNTGCILDKTELKSKPDYIIYADDTLYVRTYNTDYVFEILR